MSAIQALSGVTGDMGFTYPPGFDPALSPHEVLHIQDRYLVEQLRLLNDKRASSESQKDALEWVAEPLVTDDDVAGLGLLSFQRCCLEAHGLDPSILQERVLRLVAPHRLAMLGYE